MSADPVALIRSRTSLCYSKPSTQNRTCLSPLSLKICAGSPHLSVPAATELESIEQSASVAPATAPTPPFASILGDMGVVLDACFVAWCVVSQPVSVSLGSECVSRCQFQFNRCLCSAEMEKSEREGDGERQQYGREVDGQRQII